MKIDNAKKLIEIARNAIKTRKMVETNFKEKRGVFVTLETFPERELRGCIGYSEPIFFIGEGVQKSAISAAYEDPRFPPLSNEELEKIIIEISILSNPEKIETNIEEKILQKIIPGKHGLILKSRYNNGLFLPQVWEKISEKKNFLNELCIKAGLNKECWKNPNVDIYKFQVDAFVEKEPKGDIIKK